MCLKIHVKHMPFQLVAGHLVLELRKQGGMVDGWHGDRSVGYPWVNWHGSGRSTMCRDFHHCYVVQMGTVWPGQLVVEVPVDVGDGMRASFDQWFPSWDVLRVSKFKCDRLYPRTLTRIPQIAFFFHELSISLAPQNRCCQSTSLRGDQSRQGPRWWGSHIYFLKHFACGKFGGSFFLFPSADT